MKTKEKILIVATGVGQPQTGGVRLAREGTRALSEVADIVVKEWKKDFQWPISKNYLITNLEICKWLIHEKPTAFFCDSRMFPLVWIAVTVSQLLGIKYITTLQGNHNVTGEKGWQGHSGKLRVLLLKFICRRSHILIANSSVTYDLAVNEYGIRPDRVKIVLPGFEPYSLSVDSKDVHKCEDEWSRVLCVSRYTWGKGVDILLEAMKMDGCLWCKSIVVGDKIGGNDGKIYWNSLISQTTGIDIELRGKASQDELSKLYEWADVVVVPSRYEAFGIVVLESLCNGVPVIASDALPEEVLSISDHVHTFNSEDPKDLSLKLYELRKNKLIGKNIDQFSFNEQAWTWSRFRADFAKTVMNALQ